MFHLNCLEPSICISLSKSPKNPESATLHWCLHFSCLLHNNTLQFYLKICSTLCDNILKIIWLGCYIKVVPVSDFGKPLMHELKGHKVPMIPSEFVGFKSFFPTFVAKFVHKYEDYRYVIKMKLYNTIMPFWNTRG